MLFFRNGQKLMFQIEGHLSRKEYLGALVIYCRFPSADCGPGLKSELGNIDCIQI